jgi:hypothetical protein
MASSSTSPASSLPPLGAKVTEKLTRENYILWKAQIMPAIRDVNLVPILTGASKEPPETVEITKDGKSLTVPNRDRERWVGAGSATSVIHPQLPHLLCPCSGGNP